MTSPIFPQLVANLPPDRSFVVTSARHRARLPEHARYIGRCKTCGRSLKVEGVPSTLVRTNPSYAVYDGVVTDDGRALICADLGTSLTKVKVQCACGKWPTLEMVHEGNKQSKHACGARCTNATGPACDCRCKGANHGSGAGSA